MQKITFLYEINLCPALVKIKFYVQAENVNNTLLIGSYWTDKAVGGKSPKCFIKDLNIYIYTQNIFYKTYTKSYTVTKKTLDESNGKKQQQFCFPL